MYTEDDIGSRKISKLWLKFHFQVNYSFIKSATDFEWTVLEKEPASSTQHHLLVFLLNKNVLQISGCKSNLNEQQPAMNQLEIKEIIKKHRVVVGFFYMHCLYFVSLLLVYGNSMLLHKNCVFFGGGSELLCCCVCSVHMQCESDEKWKDTL